MLLLTCFAPFVYSGPEGPAFWQPVAREGPVPVHGPLVGGELQVEHPEKAHPARAAVLQPAEMPLPGGSPANHGPLPERVRSRDPARHGAHAVVAAGTGGGTRRPVGDAERVGGGSRRVPSRRGRAAQTSRPELR